MHHTDHRCSHRQYGTIPAIQNVGSRVDRCGERERRTLFAIFYAADAVLEPLDISLQDHSSPSHVIRLRLLQVGGFDVKAGGESPIPCAGHDDGADLWIDGESVENGSEFEPHRFEESVQLLGAVDFYMGDEREGGADEEVLVVGLGRHRGCPGLTAWDEGLGYVGGPLTSQLTCETGGANDLSELKWDCRSGLDLVKFE
jgi:hypothetical protein